MCVGGVTLLALCHYSFLEGSNLHQDVIISSRIKAFLISFLAQEKDLSNIA